MAYHAKLSPSSAERWSSCTASIGAQEGLPNKSSGDSRNGTACHQMLEEVLVDQTLDIQSYLGRVLVFWQHPESSSSGEFWADKLTEQDWLELVIEAEVPVTQDMIDATRAVADFVLEQHLFFGGELLVERAVPIDHITGETGATGRTDITLLGDDWVHVIDAKFGRKRVKASRLISPAFKCNVTGADNPEKRGPNLQMSMYASGSIRDSGRAADIKRVTMTIAQPALRATDSYSCSIEELNETERFLAKKAKETFTDPKFEPTFENCFFCLARGDCPAQTAKAIEKTLDGFEDIDSVSVRKTPDLGLGDAYRLVPFVERWTKDVSERVLEKLQAGEPVVCADGAKFKLVAGKEGPRKWADPAAAEAAMAAMRLKRELMYDFSLISPTTAEKLAKVKKVKKGETPELPILGGRQWEKLQTLITRSETKPVIALDTDPRPVVANTTGFEDAPPLNDLSEAALFGE